MRRMLPWRATLNLAVATLAVASAFATTALAESQLRLPYPDVFETIPASTYDIEHKRVGGAHLVIEKLDNGNVRIFSESGIEGGARTVAVAELVPVDSAAGRTGRALRPITQESRSFDPDGTPLGRLLIDHESSTASCSKADDAGLKLVQELPLPNTDLVANVPLNLLFLPLVRGETESTSFQFFLCREGARFVDFEAHVTRRENASNGSGPIVEIGYGPDFGSVLSLLARNFIPKLFFWFDPKLPNAWVGHRLPLYSKGPEVFVVRDGVSVGRLGE